MPNTGNVTGVANSASNGCGVLAGYGIASASTSAFWQIAIPIKVASGAHIFSVAFSYDYTLVASFSAGASSCPLAKNVPGIHTSSYCSWGVGAGSNVGMEIYDQTNNSYLYGGYDSAGLPQNYSYASTTSYCNGSGTCSSSNYSLSCSNSIYYHRSFCAPSGTTAKGSNTTYINSGDNCWYWNTWRVHLHSCFNWTMNGSHKLWILAFVDVYTFAELYNYGTGSSALATVNGATLRNIGWKVISVTVT
ncbi:MAG TPA: hypothetical protein VFF67_04125 [Thermoplasmata archaeon]|nr:hypothetical protein [Thermoplasmata archaeon]